MDFIHNERFASLAQAHKRPLIHTKKVPVCVIGVVKDEGGFQGFGVERLKDASLPVFLSAGDSITLDFGCHCVGYLHYSLTHELYAITDSPAVLEFSFGEFPLELECSLDGYKGVLGNGWIQRETRSVAITPHSHELERRYSFRYLRITRKDNAAFPLIIDDLYADCVSAVDVADVPELDIPDETLKRIYDASVRTLKECSQDVFEDGPKRDRRLWSGDLRLEALTDHVTFKNTDLVKRCIYLFAAYRYKNKFVSQCIFPDSYPYVYRYIFYDYSLFFISFLYDYLQKYDDIEFVRELYPLALEQAELVFDVFENNYKDFCSRTFIDWCEKLDKSVSMLGLFVYTLKQLSHIGKKLLEDVRDVDEKICRVKSALLARYSEEHGLFVCESGQISRHSQIWAVLADVLSPDQNRRVLEKMEQAGLDIYPHTPYMMHYYIDALYSCGEKEKAMQIIRDYWGSMLDLGFDCCVEVFNPKDYFESPYKAPELNSACHAWSCTPAYWIYRYYNE